MYSQLSVQKAVLEVSTHPAAPAPGALTRGTPMPRTPLCPPQKQQTGSELEELMSRFQRRGDP